MDVPKFTRETKRCLGYERPKKSPVVRPHRLVMADPAWVSDGEGVGCGTMTAVGSADSGTGSVVIESGTAGAMNSSIDAEERQRRASSSTRQSKSPGLRPRTWVSTCGARATGRRSNTRMPRRGCCNPGSGEGWRLPFGWVHQRWIQRAMTSTG